MNRRRRVRVRVIGCLIIVGLLADATLAGLTADWFHGFQLRASGA